MYLLITVVGEHAQDLDGHHEGSSHLFASVPGPMQTLQGADYWRGERYFCTSSVHVGIIVRMCLEERLSLSTTGMRESPSLLSHVRKTGLTLSKFP